jgi:hypothetical protein
MQGGRHCKIRNDRQINTAKGKKFGRKKEYGI